MCRRELVRRLTFELSALRATLWAWHFIFHAPAPVMGWTPPALLRASSCQLVSCGAGVSATKRKESAMDATTVAVDLAKNVFELAVADGHWRIIQRHRLSRGQFERWFANHTLRENAARPQARTSGLCDAPLSPSFPPPLALETDRPSWPTGITPPRAMPITTPAEPAPSLAAIGATMTQIPSRHGTPHSHLRCRIYDCRYFPNSHQTRSDLLLAGGVHIRTVKPRQARPL